MPFDILIQERNLFPHDLIIFIRNRAGPSGISPAIPNNQCHGLRVVSCGFDNMKIEFLRQRFSSFNRSTHRDLSRKMIDPYLGFMDAPKRVTQNKNQYCNYYYRFPFHSHVLQVQQGAEKRQLSSALPKRATRRQHFI